MESYIYILHKLIRVLDRLPSETAAAVLLILLTHPGVLSFIVLTIVGGLVTWYVTRIFAIHVWPEIPPEHLQRLLQVLSLVLMEKSDQPTDRDGESAYSRNSKRHPHW